MYAEDAMRCFAQNYRSARVGLEAGEMGLGEWGEGGGNKTTGIGHEDDL